MQEETQRTFETEKIKAAIASATDESLVRIKSDIQRNMAFVSYTRELIAKHHDAMITALRECITLSEYAKYEVPYEKYDHIKSRMVENLTSIRLSSSLLKSLEVIDESVFSELSMSIETMQDRWDSVISMKISNSPGYKKNIPDARHYKLEEFWDEYISLVRVTKELTDSCLKTIRTSSVPL